MSEEFAYSVWWRNGYGGAVRRDALPLNHPESVVSLWKNKFGNLYDFPWEDVYGRLPTKSELILGGLGEYLSSL